MKMNFLLGILLCVSICEILVYSNSQKQFELDVPSVEQAIKDGYPINENGLTYGPDIKDNTDINSMPDLLLVEPDKGEQGYVYVKDISDDDILTIEQALEKSSKKKHKTIPMYFQDGKTIKGYITF